MKKFTFLLLFILSVVEAFAIKDKHPERATHTSSLQVSFINHHNEVAHADSVLVIFDRYDHSGAGVVYKVFYPDQNQSIEIGDVPAGKYYVSIRCLGIHHDYVEKVVKIEKDKSNMLKIKLLDCEVFTKEAVVIPPTAIDLKNLTVTTIH
jgi:hypothetical protein